METITKQDVNVEVVNGSLVLSTVANGYRVKQTYFSFTRAQAMKLFLEKVAKEA